MTATAEVTDDLDLGEYNPAAVEKELETGGKLPPGKYHVRLASTEDKAWRSGDRFHDLKFTILAGPHAGQTHRESLNGFTPGTTDDKKKSANNRYLLFASRLGLYDTAGGKYRLLKAKTPHEFSGCVGAEVIIEINHRSDKDDPTKKYAQITFAGIYSLTDPKVKDVARAAPGDRPAAAAATTQPAGYDTSDL